MIILYLQNRYANDISLGDEVVIGGKDGLTTAKVVNLHSSTMQGNIVFKDFELQY